MRNLFNGGPVYGGTFPAIIFHNYMEAALAGQPVVGFPAAPPPPAPPPGRARRGRPVPGEAQAILAQAGFAPASGRSQRPAQGRVVRQGPAPAPGCARAAPCTWPCPAAAAAAT